MASETYKKLLADVQDPDKGSQLITLNQLWKYLNTIDENSSTVKSIQLTLNYPLGGFTSFGVLDDPTGSTISFTQAGVGEFDLQFSNNLSSYSYVCPIIKAAMYTAPAMFVDIAYVGSGLFKIYTFDFTGTVSDIDLINTYVQIQLA